MPVHPERVTAATIPGFAGSKWRRTLRQARLLEAQPVFRGTADHFPAAPVFHICRIKICSVIPMMPSVIARCSEVIG